MREIIARNKLLEKALDETDIYINLPVKNYGNILVSAYLMPLEYHPGTTNWYILVLVMLLQPLPARKKNNQVFIKDALETN